MTRDEAIDVVVIGSGIGGLTAARLLAEFGRKKVLVLERHYTLGGMMHEFIRDGRFHFGTGLHYLGSEPGPLLDYLSDGRMQWHRLPGDFDILHFPGFDFAVPSSAAEFRRRLKAQFPGEADGIDRFFAAARWAAGGLIARNIVASLPPLVRRLAQPIIELASPDTFRSIRDVAARSLRDPALRAIVSARSGLFGLPPASSAFGYQALVPLMYYADGASFPVGGPRELGEAVIEAAERRGVVLRARQHVHRIVVEDGRCAGVDVEDRATGTRYTVTAPCVVSAAGLRNTRALLDTPAIQSWEQEVAKLPDGPSALLLFLGFDKSPETFGLRGENHWFMPDLDEDAGYALPPGEGMLYVSFSSLNNPAARAHTAEVLQLIDAKAIEDWFGTEESTRPEAYREFKAQVTQRLIARLDERWPGFKSNVAFCELATPLSFMTYQASHRGAFYGLATGPERLRSRLAASRTPVKGLFLAGQDAWNPGIGAALVGGALAASAILKRNMGTWFRLRVDKAAVSPWRGYMRVSRIETLTPSVKRFRLEPLADGDALPFAFKPGQYVKLDLPVADGTIERAYSISSGPDAKRRLEISVKREAQGLGSTFLHDAVEVGQVLRLSGPLGDFTCDPAQDIDDGRLLLVAGGVGITPLMSVLAAAADAGYSGPITLMASFRSEADILFASEIEALKARLPRLDAQVFLTSPGAMWQGGRGRIDLVALRPHVANLARVQLCGPAPMMEAVIGSLTRLAVPRDMIHTEAFISSQAKTEREEKARAIAKAAEDAGISRFTVALRGGAAFACKPGQTILAAANAAQVPFKQSCNEGVCGKCRAQVLSGAFETDARGLLSGDETAAGWVLACQTLPTRDLEIGV